MGILLASDIILTYVSQMTPYNTVLLWLVTQSRAQTDK